jgi:VWFA-related protein
MFPNGLLSSGSVRVLTSVSLALVLLVSVLAAQEMSLHITQILPPTEGEVSALVSVVDRQEQPVRGLTAANFSLMIDGQAPLPIRAQTAGEKGEGIAVVLAMDVSGSMKGQAIRSACEAAKGFVDRLTARDVCSIMTFGTGVNQVVDFTSDKGKLKSRLDGIQATDQTTYLNLALYDAASKAAAAPLTAAAVLILTDGKDEGSPITLDDAIANAQERNIPICARAFGTQIQREPLRRLAKLTGGRFLHAPTLDDLESIYGLALDQLKSQYIVTGSLGSLGAGEHSLIVEVSYRGRTLRDEKQFFASAPLRSSASSSRSERLRGRSLGKIGLVVVILVAAVVAVLLLVRARGHKPPPTPMCAWCGAEPALEGQAYCAKCATEEHGPPEPGELVWLDAVAGTMAGQRIFLTGDTLIIGRGGKSDLVIRGDREVSRHHAEIVKDSRERYTIVDKKSRNGTFVNGNRIEQETLLTGDKIRVGQTELVFTDHRKL